MSEVACPKCGCVDQLRLGDITDYGCLNCGEYFDVRISPTDTNRQAHELERQQAWVAFAKTAMRSTQEEEGVGLTDDEVMGISSDADKMLAEFDKRFSKEPL